MTERALSQVLCHKQRSGKICQLYYALVRRMVNKNMPAGGFDCYPVDRKVIEVLERLDEKNSFLTLQAIRVGFQTDMMYFVR